MADRGDDRSFVSENSVTNKIEQLAMPRETKLGELKTSSIMKSCIGYFLEDTPKKDILNHLEEATKYKGRLGSKTLPEIYRITDKRDFLRYICYSDFQPELVNMKDVHLLNAKYEFDTKLNLALGTAHLLYLLRPKGAWRRGLYRMLLLPPVYAGWVAVFCQNLVFRLLLEHPQEYFTGHIDKQIMDKYDFESAQFQAAYNYMRQTG